MNIKIYVLSNNLYVCKGKIYKSLSNCVEELNKNYPGDNKFSVAMADIFTNVYWVKKCQKYNTL